jgi:hypothetical protein
MPGWVNHTLQPMFGQAIPRPAAAHIARTRATLLLGFFGLVIAVRPEKRRPDKAPRWKTLLSMPKSLRYRFADYCRVTAQNQDGCRDM